MALEEAWNLPHFGGDSHPVQDQDNHRDHLQTTARWDLLVVVEAQDFHLCFYPVDRTASEHRAAGEQARWVAFEVGEYVTCPRDT